MAGKRIQFSHRSVPPSHWATRRYVWRKARLYRWIGLAIDMVNHFRL